MSSITWNETSPAAASLATNTDDTIRSDLTAMATGIGESFFWPGSAASAGASASSGGETVLGIARFHRGPSRFTTAEDGFVSIDTGGDYGVSLRHIGVSTIESFPVGHCNIVEELNTAGTVDTRWLEQQETHTFAVDGVDTNTITFPIAYNGVPAVRASIRGEISTSINSFSFGIFNITATTFQSTMSYIGPGGSPAVSSRLDWVSKGTVTI